MSTRDYKYTEKLYLRKGGSNDIFIDEAFTHRLKTFQKDGIRFLYRQYVKKKPGVILNDPPGYGKTVQGVLFLNAMRQQLRPLASLVLCSESSLPHWRNHFCAWTDCANDILDESGNIYSKKDVFISSFESCAAMCKRNWGIVVVDDLKTAKHMKQLKRLDADFNIWLTNENLVDNLSALSSIYEWIYKNKFDIKAYDTTGLSAIQRIERDIALDIFCEDLMIRRSGVPLPLGDADNHRENDNGLDVGFSINENNDDRIRFNVATNHNVKDKSTTKSKPVVTEKNKDSTGLKIKRTKKSTDIVSTNSYINNTDYLAEQVANKKSKSIGMDNQRIVFSTIKTLPDERILNDNASTEIANNEQNIFKIVDPSMPEVINVDNDIGMTGQPVANASTDERISKEITIVNDSMDVDPLTSNQIGCKKYVSTTIDEILFPILEEYKNVSSDENENNDVTCVKEVKHERNELESNLEKKDLKSSVMLIEDMIKKQFKGSFLDNLF